MSGRASPLVSVIIPTYNRREYVQKAIDSVLLQTYPHFELIVIDDGSTDGTGEVLRERYGDRVRYEWQRNQGESIARNTGINISRGEYVALLDSDDVWLPDKLVLQVRLAEELGNVVLVSGHVRRIGPHDEILDPGPLHTWQQADTVCIEDIALRSPLHASTLLARRSAMVDELWFDPDITFGEDWHFCLRLASKGAVGFVQSTIVSLRSHDGMQTLSTATKSRVDRRLADRLRVIEETFPCLPLCAEKREALRKRAMALELSEAAFGYYCHGLHELGEEQLRRALSLAPEDLGNGARCAELLQRNAILVAQQQGLRNARVFASLVSKSVAKTVPAYAQLKRQTMAKIHIGLGFCAHQLGQRAAVLRHLALGAALDPQWACNRGVWSLTMQSLAGPKLYCLMRNMVRRSH